MNIVSAGCTDSVTGIHTSAIIKRSSFSAAIPELCALIIESAFNIETDLSIFRLTHINFSYTIKYYIENNYALVIEKNHQEFF